MEHLEFEHLSYDQMVAKRSELVHRLDELETFMNEEPHEESHYHDRDDAECDLGCLDDEIAKRIHEPITVVCVTKDWRGDPVSTEGDMLSSAHQLDLFITQRREAHSWATQCIQETRDLGLMHWREARSMLTTLEFIVSHQS